MVKKNVAAFMITLFIIFAGYQSFLFVSADGQLPNSSLDDMVLSNEELEALGFPENDRLESRVVDPSEIFTDSNLFAKKAQINVLDGKEFIYAAKSDPEVMIGIRIVALTSASWAKIRPLANWNTGNDDYAISPAYWLLQKRTNGKTTWFATAAKGRLQVAVYMIRDLTSTGMAEADYQILGRLIFNRQLEKIPLLEDTTQQTTIDLSQERLLTGIAFGLLITAIQLLSAALSVFGDTGSRERYRLFSKHQSKPDQTFDVRVMALSRQMTSGWKGNLLFIMRSIALGAIGSTLYFVTGKMSVLGMMVIFAAVLFAVSFLELSFKIRKQDQDVKLFSVTRTYFLMTVLAMGSSTVIYCFGILLLLLSLTGLSVFSGLQNILASLSLLVAGLIVLTNTGRPVRLVRKILQPFKKKMISEDERQEILLLRSFQDDQLEIRVQRESRHTLMEQVTLERLERFEELVAWNLWQVGPVIAIGQHGKLLEPLGAVRYYFSDDDWQDHVLTMMKKDQLITFVVGRSPSLLWEIAQAKETGSLGKCLFLVPPVPAAEASKRLLVLSGALGIAPGCLGLDEQGKTKQPISALFFNESGEPVIIVAKARNDKSYQIAIKTAVSQMNRGTGQKLYAPAPKYWHDPPPDMDSLLVKFTQRSNRKRNRILHFIFDVLMSFIN
jgi:hypothetical protein